MIPVPAREVSQSLKLSRQKLWVQFPDSWLSILIDHRTRLSQNKLIQEMAGLKKLEELTIYYPDERMSSFFSKRPHIHSAIRNMVIPEPERRLFAFDIVFQEARYQLTAPGFFKVNNGQDSTDDISTRGWRFTDINATEDDVKEEEDEEARAGANVTGMIEPVHFDDNNIND